MTDESNGLRSTNLSAELHKAADGLEYDRHWSVPVIRQAADELDEMKRGHILGDKELISAVITAVMSNKQGDRDDAVRALQKHIVAVERERDNLETECERKNDYLYWLHDAAIELNKYADHTHMCAVSEQGADAECTCGYADAARVALGDQP